MDKNLKAKWIYALRSGRYKQARNELVGSKLGSYCCLGVLSRIMEPRKPVGAIDYPPTSVVSSYMQRNLADLNDGRHGEAYDFKQIANFIKVNL